NSESDLPFELLDFLSEHGHSFKEVTDDSVIRDVEDGSFRVFVNRHDSLRVLHADQMLNRTRDADRNLELRRHGLTRRSNLSIDWQPLRIANGTRRGQIAAQRFGKFFRQPEIIFAFDTTTDRDNDVGLTEIDSLL